MALSGPEILLYEKKDKVVTITINRPERMNSVSIELMERLAEAWAQFRDDDDAWVAIITGSGDKAFCTGRDLIEQSETGLPKKLAQYFVRDIWKPIIAAINGYAIAGGWQLAQSCDIRIAAEHAELGIAETRWNMPTFWVHDLTRQLQLAHALEIVLWGNRRITAQRGYEMGWINKVVPKEKLMEEALSWADDMRYLAPRCVRNSKQILYRGFYLPPSEAEAFAMALGQNLAGMEDSTEGSKAFAEKRKPVFKNK